MSDSISPDEMTPDERLREVAAILARGVLRLHMRGSEIPAENGQNPLDSGAKTSPHVDTVNEGRDSEKGG